MVYKVLKKMYHLLPLSDSMRAKIRRRIRVESIAGTGKVDIYGDRQPKLNVTSPRKISVIIPNYNYEKYITERIDSILFQTYPIYELIILDDCSRDNSVQVIKEKIKTLHTDFPVTLIENERNSGNVFAQWKKAFEIASGDYVWIAEADDSSNARFLETVIKEFDDEKVVISYCESLTMDEENRLLMGDLRPWIDQFGCRKWDKNYKKDGVEEIGETMCINNTIANVSSVVFKNGDYAKYMEEAKQFKLAGDWYVYMRILEHGKIAYNSQSLNYHRMQQQGLTLSTSHEKEFEEIVFLQNYAMEHYPVSSEVKEKVLQRRERERVRFGL